MEGIDFSKFSHVLFQLENDLATVARGLKLAREAGCIGADRAAAAVMKKESQ